MGPHEKLRALIADRALTQAALWGAGLETGHTWHWSGVVLEAGFGVQHSGYAAHRAFDGSPIPRPSWKPLSNGSVGYGW